MDVSDKGCGLKTNLIALYPPPTPVLNQKFKSACCWVDCFQVYRRCGGNGDVVGSDFSEMLWDKTMLGYCNVLSGVFLERHSQIVKKNRMLVWETRFERGTSREGSKYANCPTAPFRLFNIDLLLYFCVTLWHFTYVCYIASCGGKILVDELDRMARSPWPVLVYYPIICFEGCWGNLVIYRVVFITSQTHLTPTPTLHPIPPEHSVGVE